MLRGYDDYEVTLGDLMRGERATRGWKMEEAARRVALPVKILVAIEDGRILPEVPDALMSGFVRSYGRILQMDQDFCSVRYWSEVEKKNTVKLSQPKSEMPIAITMKSSGTALGGLMSRLLSALRVL